MIRLSAEFSLPRNMYPNEDIYFDLGKDISDVNRNTDRLEIML